MIIFCRYNFTPGEILIGLYHHLGLPDFIPSTTMHGYERHRYEHSPAFHCDSNWLNLQIVPVLSVNDFRDLWYKLNG